MNLVAIDFLTIFYQAALDNWHPTIYRITDILKKGSVPNVPVFLHNDRGSPSPAVLVDAVQIHQNNDQHSYNPHPASRSYAVVTAVQKFGLGQGLDGNKIFASDKNSIAIRCHGHFCVTRVSN